jgi:hypothetical protein
MVHVDAYGKICPTFIPGKTRRLTLHTKFDALDLIHTSIFDPARAAASCDDTCRICGKMGQLQK